VERGEAVKEEKGAIWKIKNTIKWTKNALESLRPC